MAKSRGMGCSVSQARKSGKVKRDGWLSREGWVAMPRVMGG